MHKNSENPNLVENVVVLEGVRSLGAFGCGVLKAVRQHNIKIDIIAGTLNGGINAAIFAGSKDVQHPERSLEEFWLDIAGNSASLRERFKERRVQQQAPFPDFSRINAREIKSTLSTPASSISTGRTKNMPRWGLVYTSDGVDFFSHVKDSFSYDYLPMLDVLEKYLDYGRLRPGGKPNARLILIAVNVLTLEMMIFDSSKMQITPRHLLAISGYQSPNPTVEVERGVYAWDGSLSRNSPLEVVMEASTANKKVIMVDYSAQKINKLPEGPREVVNRTKDIIYWSKTAQAIKQSKVMAKKICLLTNFMI